MSFCASQLLSDAFHVCGISLVPIYLFWVLSTTLKYLIVYGSKIIYFAPLSSHEIHNIALMLFRSCSTKKLKLYEHAPSEDSDRTAHLKQTFFMRTMKTLPSGHMT